MDITEPKYFTEFRKDLDRMLDEKLDKKLEKSFDDFAIIIAKQFSLIDKRFDTIEYEIIGIKNEMKNFATKQDFNEIKSLIGSYEIRSRKIEEILIDDHKPRIKELEKAVFKLA